MQNQLRRARGYFFQAPDAIFDMPPTLTLQALAVYLCLQKYADRRNTAFPSYETLMKECRIKSKQTICNALKCLIEHGLLDKQHQYNKLGRRTSNLYTLYDPPYEKDSPSNRPNEALLSPPDGISLSPPDGISLSPPDGLEPKYNNEPNSLTNQTQLNLTKAKAENEPNELKKETVKLSQVKSSSTSNVKNEIKKPKEAIKKEKIKPRAEITAEVKKQIQYDWLADRFSDDISKPILDEILNTLVNGLRSERQYWTLRGENIPTEELQKRFRERDVTDIQSLVEDILRKTKPIGNPGAYIAAALYRYGDGDHTKFTTMYNADVANGLFAR